MTRSNDETRKKKQRTKLDSLEVPFTCKNYIQILPVLLLAVEKSGKNNNNNNNSQSTTSWTA